MRCPDGTPVAAAAAPAGLRVHRFTAFGGAHCEVLASPRVSEHALSAAVADVYAFEARLTRFDARSELSQLNARAGDRVAVSALLEEMLRTCLEAFHLSGGLVNAAVLPALCAAGYDATIAQVRRRERVVAAPAMPVPPLPDVLEVGPGWAALRAGCAVDLGGVGKGWLADRLAERLGDAAVNLGGDLRAIGGGPDGAGWCIGLCDGSSVAVGDAGVATSGVGGRRWRGGHHLVDPRTGTPAASDLLAVSVVAVDAVTAEVLAKTAVLMGAGEGPAHVAWRGARRVATVAGTAVAA